MIFLSPVFHGLFTTRLDPKHIALRNFSWWKVGNNRLCLSLLVCHARLCCWFRCSLLSLHFPNQAKVTEVIAKQIKWVVSHPQGASTLSKTFIFCWSKINLQFKINPTKSTWCYFYFTNLQKTQTSSMLSYGWHFVCAVIFCSNWVGHCLIWSFLLNIQKSK